jgi:hypothetical protein
MIDCTNQTNIDIKVRDELQNTLNDMKAALSYRQMGSGLPTYCLDEIHDCKTMRKVINSLDTVIEYCYHIEDDKENT